MHPARQRFELALLGALDRAREKPVLGVCLGMQLMGVHRAGPGALVQHLGDALATAPAHQHDLHHAIVPTAHWGASRLASLDHGAHVASNHHQALSSAGPLRVLAHSPDGVIEAVDDPLRPFYVGVQWHPERTRDERLGQRVIAELVRAAGG
jgi:putative glutamine amidotransferase